MKQTAEVRKSRLAIIAAHGTLDDAYPPLLLAAAGIAMNMEVAIFFTYYGLNIVKKDFADKLKFAPPADHAIADSIPNVIRMLPGITTAATAFVKNRLKKASMEEIGDLLSMSAQSGVALLACEMTLEVLGIKKEQLINAVQIVAAGTFLEFANKNAITLSF